MLSGKHVPRQLTEQTVTTEKRRAELDSICVDDYRHAMAVVFASPPT